MKRLVACVALLGLIGLSQAGTGAMAVELVRLGPANWDEYVPAGKEVDAIYGDLVLRNDHLIAVIAAPLPTRHANMTVRNVGGMIIDLTRRERPNDQLSAYYPCGSRYTFTDPTTMKVAIDNQAAQLTQRTDKLAGKSISIELTADRDPKARQSLARVTLRYTLNDGESFLRVESVHRNETDKPMVETFVDGIRADKVFRFGTDDALFATSPVARSPNNLFWASDEWFGQSYGVICDGRQIRLTSYDRPQLQITQNGTAEATIAPAGSITLSRKIFPGATVFDVREKAQQLAGAQSRPIEIHVTDPGGPVKHALVAIDEPNGDHGARQAPALKPAAAQPIDATYPTASYGLGRTDDEGRLRAAPPPGNWRLTVRAIGHPDSVETIDTRTAVDAIRREIKLEAPGYVEATITDDGGRPIPAKVAFFGKGGTPDPFFGPDTGEIAVHNLYYTHNGRFRQEIAPGRYDVIASYGPEYDAVFQEIEVKRGEVTPLAARLAHSVNTRGWVSTDYHSHSSPSGDNVTSQTGRVLNLLCEHIEFAPCTEHNRIDTYVPILERFGVVPFMATCSGMELTGSPLPVNHQNAFPLVRKPHTQDGGAPETSADPVVQIERLALWDNKSDKLVQGNHPNLPQILGDRDLNGVPDDGLRKMFGFMDVVEVHPLEEIFNPPANYDRGKGPRNPIFHWMQMTNLGYRIPGVVNTDAHYTFHGSGGLRNYVRSSTDDPAKIDTMEMVHESEAGHIVMTNGPFLEVSAQAVPAAAAKQAAPKQGATSAIPGDDLTAPDGLVALSIRVQCPNWFDINRVQVFLNGRPEKHVNFTRREHPKYFGSHDAATDAISSRRNGDSTANPEPRTLPARRGGNPEPSSSVRFQATIPVKLTNDTHIIVAAIGEGLTLGRVMGPSWGKQPPTAVSNPIFVDVDGGGFKPNGDLLGVPLPVDQSFRAERRRD